MGISYDSVPVLATFSKAHGITFPLLADEGSATIKRYGILATVGDEFYGPNGNDPELLADLRKYVTILPMDEKHLGLPYPGTLIVDAKGRVTSRFFEEFYRERNTVSSVMLKIGAGGPPVQATRVSGSHLTISTYSTDASVALGNRFSLVVEVTPESGIHVYAPGAAGYKVLTLSIAPQPFVRVLPVSYPASEIYHFKELDEKVETYGKPFTLVQDIAILATPEAKKLLAASPTVTISGRLEYQACDDRVCYAPKKVPVSFTLNVKDVAQN